MSTYNGRHGPNVSQYLRDLNIIQPQDSTTDDTFNMEDNLSLFTNTQFFDFDSGENTDYQAQPIKPEGKAAPAAPQSATTSEDVADPSSVIGDMTNLDFPMSHDFNFADFNNSYAGPPMNNFQDGTQNFQPLGANHAGAVQIPQQAPQFDQNGAPVVGDTLKSDALSGAGRPLNFEDASRKAAEEEKRKRNTAASARFRIKKKQKEQALEKSAKDMVDKMTAFENRISQLETENKWLKNLLVEKNDSNEDISALWKEFTKQASEKTKPTAEKPSSVKAEGPAEDER